MKLLFTGFEANANEATHPSWHWADGLRELAGDEHSIQSVALPSTWDGSFPVLRQLLNQGWDAVICLGARKSEQLAIERLALNESDPSCRDCSGRRPRAKVIDPDGDPGYWTGLPYRELGLQLSFANVPSAPSHSAGGGLPNFVFYQLMHWISLSRRTLIGGLIQVPLEGELAYPKDDTRRRFLRGVIATLTRSAAEADSLMIDLNRIGSLRNRPVGR